MISEERSHVDSGEYKARLQPERMLWWQATGVILKILGDADSRRQCARDGFERVESNGW
jgi:hypothetical protein